MRKIRQPAILVSSVLWGSFQILGFDEDAWPSNTWKLGMLWSWPAMKENFRPCRSGMAAVSSCSSVDVFINLELQVPDDCRTESSLKTSDS